MALLTDNKFGYTAKYNFDQLPYHIKRHKDVKNRLDYLSKN